MAITIQQSFSKFRSNLEISTLQTEVVSTRQTNVRSALESDLNVEGSFLTGSYARSTMIAPLVEADIDIFVVLDPRYYHHYNGQNGGQAGLLDYLKRIIRKTYTRTPDVSRNGQAVTIRFEDFVVDVVPGFRREGGGYLIPNSITQGWISTDPKKHVQIFKDANTAHDGDLIPLVKMIKCWNRKVDRHFHSFHLEVLILQILDGVTINDFSSGARYVFDKARDLITKQNADPSGYAGDVGYYLNTKEKVNAAVQRFETAYSRAIRAESAASGGRIVDAIDTWRLIFGDDFPIYG